MHQIDMLHLAVIQNFFLRDCYWLTLYLSLWLFQNICQQTMTPKVSKQFIATLCTKELILYCLKRQGYGHRKSFASHSRQITMLPPHHTIFTQWLLFLTLTNSATASI